jgi:hypothetical protein
MNPLRRTAIRVVIALALTLVAAAPVAAAQPDRYVIPGTLVSHYPAGEGCDFDVTAYKQPSAHTTVTTFSDGTQFYDAHSLHRRIVNDATGAEYDDNIVSHEVDHVDGAGIDHGSISGQFIWTFLVGDVYVDGSVMDHVTSLDMVGRATYTVDWNTGATLAISFVGQYTDICAALS